MALYSGLRAIYWRCTNYPAGRYKRLLEESHAWPTEQLQEFRDEKLRHLLVHCFENVPYYRDAMNERGLRPHDFRGARDLPKLPVLTKAILRAHAGRLLADNLKEMSVSWARTGGTTGEPMRVARNRECTAWATMCYERGLGWGGWTVDRRRVRLFGGSLGIDKASLRARVGRRLQGDVFIPAFELTSATALAHFQRIRRSGSRFLIGYASAIYRLATLAEELDQDISFDSVFPTAEILLPQWKETIARVFDCRVLPYYGCGEVNSLGYFSEDIQAYKVPNEHALIEVLQLDGSTSLSGEGRFLITDLDNYAMPIIRYANGDAGKVSAPGVRAACSSIERLDGRYNSFLMTDAGELVSGVIGTHVFRHMPSVRQYRIIQREPLEVDIQVVPRDGFGESDERLLLDLFSEHLGSRMNVRVSRVGDLPEVPSGKSVFVINHCLGDAEP